MHCHALIDVNCTRTVAKGSEKVYSEMRMRGYRHLMHWHQLVDVNCTQFSDKTWGYLEWDNKMSLISEKSRARTEQNEMIITLNGNFLPKHTIKTATETHLTIPGVVASLMIQTKLWAELKKHNTKNHSNLTIPCIVASWVVSKCNWGGVSVQAATHRTLAHVRTDAGVLQLRVSEKYQTWLMISKKYII